MPGEIRQTKLAHKPDRVQPFLSMSQYSPQGVLTVRLLHLTDNVWQVQKTRGTGGRAALTSAKPANVDAPCCTSWPASSQGVARERSTWAGWVGLALSNSPWRVPFYSGVTQTCSALNLQLELLMPISKRWDFKKTIWGRVLTQIPRVRLISVEILISN